MSRSRSWCFTLNNYTELHENAIQNLSDQITYLIYGREIAPETGTPHLQGYVYFPNAKTLSAVRKLIPHAHLSLSRGDALSNYNYCSKSGDFVERGVRPKSQEEKGNDGKLAIQQRWDLAKRGKFEELPPEQIKTYEYIHLKYKAVEDREELDNIWIFGESGCGKSRYVRETYPDAYNKPMSKWWDGYTGQSVVVLDDFDPTHGKFLSYFLKIWADHYAFNAEVKGGMMKIRPLTIVITSQYNLEECFDDEKTIAALSRRFKLKNI
nr:MAG: replication associated protein [Cressdnaviricota sp.]